MIKPLQGKREVDRCKTTAERVILDYRDAFKQVSAVDEANAALRDGKPASPELYLRMAELHQRMGRAEEALAWRLLAPLSFARSARWDAGCVELPGIQDKADALDRINNPLAFTGPVNPDPCRRFAGPFSLVSHGDRSALERRNDH
jgi:hypothetical protein